jgi:hypothetical protein
MKRGVNILWSACAAALLANTMIGCARKGEEVNISSMPRALHSATASEEIPENQRIYDWLIGSWKARVVDYSADGSKRESAGEWHFAYALEGRAIQDVWISPPRSERTANTAKQGNRYGTSIRYFHPSEKMWHVVWINPVSGALNHLVAEKVNDDIVQTGKDDEGNIMRWVFSDIQANSARWYGERSMDGGKTWKLEAEFLLERNWPGGPGRSRIRPGAMISE